jgi:uncharacterized membrane protein YeiH
MLQSQHEWIRSVVLALDLGGTFVFALSGAGTGVKHRLDLFGVLVLSFAAGTAGGIARDVVIGATPPAAILDWRYVAVSVVAGLVTFYWYPIADQSAISDRLRKPILTLDAAGLGLFAVSGALKALAFQLGPVQAVLIGVLTAVGGGVARDVLVAEVPVVLHSELYASAAFAGASVVVAGSMLHLPSDATAIAGAALCFGLRVMAMQRGWRLPIAGGRSAGDGGVRSGSERSRNRG